MMHTHKPPQPVWEFVYTGLEIESVRRSRGKIIVMEYDIGGNLKKIVIPWLLMGFLNNRPTWSTRLANYS